MILVERHRLEQVQLGLKRVQRKARELSELEAALAKYKLQEDAGKLPATLTMAYKVRLQQAIKAKKKELGPNVQAIELKKLQAAQLEEERGDATEAARRVRGYASAMKQASANKPESGGTKTELYLASERMALQCKKVIEAEISLTPHTRLFAVLLTREHIPGVAVPAIVPRPVYEFAPAPPANATKPAA